MAVSVQSFLSRDPSLHITKNVEFVDRLVSSFQRVVPAMQELESGVLPLEDIRVKHQYRVLCRNLQRGSQETQVLAELVEGVVRMSRDEDRRVGIYDELNSAQGAYPKFRDFEAELKVRLEGVGKTQAKLATLCQQIEEDSVALFSSTRHSNGRGSTRRNALLVRNIAFGALSFGTLLLALGLADKGPLYSPKMNKFLFILLHVCFGGAMAACLDGWKHYSAKYLMLQEGPNVEDETNPNTVAGNFNVFVSELKQIILLVATYRADLERVDCGELPVSEVRVVLDKFFTADADPTQIETSKATLQEVISHVYSHIIR